MKPSIIWNCLECGYKTSIVWDNCKRCDAAKPIDDVRDCNVRDVRLIDESDFIRVPVLDAELVD
jgi:hypothetical protein